MNKNNRSGGIKFRELDCNRSSQDVEQTKKNQLQSKADILKLFNKSDSNQEANNCDGVREETSMDYTKSENEQSKEIKEDVVKQQNAIKLDTVKHSLKTPSNVISASTKAENISNDKKCYNVMIGKISTRKHKHWDSDGILEVCGKSAILKDIDGKFVGRTTVKPETIEEGFRLHVGGKEIEIIGSTEAIETKEETSTFLNKNNECSQKENNYDTGNEQTQRRISSHKFRNFGNVQKKQIKIDVTRIQSKIKLDIVRQNPKIQSNFIDTSTKEENISSDKKIYNVMIGKISTRKHKQWDSDGLLEVCGKSAVLKEIDGKVIGRTTIKVETIEEGLRLCIGGKEIEIVELASVQDVQDRQQSTQVSSSNESAEPPLKRAKISKGFVPVKLGSSLHFNYEPLIMPNPPLNLEWSEENDVNKIHEVSIDGCLASVLRPHQREGIVFLYKCIMGINNSNYKGAILADEMGLGKTLQCISLIWTLLKKGPNGKPVLKRVLIVAPSSLCGNWNKEFRRWLGSMKISPYVVEGKQKVKDFTKAPRACVMIISYEMFVRNVDDVNSLNFDLLICDEGHRLKNSEVKTLKSLSQLNCQRRILLTGTPVQNDLQEFYILANFVNPGILGSFSEYKRHYEHAIVTSQRATADEEEEILGQERAKELYERSKTFILRRTTNLINQYLPQKHELVIFCRLTREQNNLYELITDYWFNRSVIDGHVIPLAVITALKKVCNHPYLFTSEKSNMLHEVLPLVPTNLTAINSSFVYSSKVTVVQAIFQNLKKTKEKIVLVSYFTKTLDLLEKVCCSEGMQFCRLDGSTPATSRTKIVERFNSKDNFACHVFLLSAKAGGVGLNLVGASRLVLFDSDWNPANDAQAMARIWRDGQKHSVYIYRLLTTGTIEEKIYQRQISKTGLSEAVIDANHTPSLKLSSDELKDLFTLDSETLSVTHDLMECSCIGSGDIPHEKEESSGEEDSRDCQFDLKKKPAQQQITMNQLLSWQHYKKPIFPDLLKELMLQQVQEYVTFVFKNSIEK